MKADVLVIGAGISGLQASLDLADQGRQVLLVEQNPSIGGRMINLSKVYPTLDCASCITTPRMASAAHHPNVCALTYSEVKSVERVGSGFKVVVVKKPRYVKEDDCIGCKRCEEACPIYLPDGFEHGLGATKAIAIPFTNAVPQVPVLDVTNCTLCGACANVCPTDCIDFLQEPVETEYDVGAVLVTTGYDLTPMDAKTQYGAGRFINVLSALQGERLLAPHGPFGRVLRPSDGKIPDSIAFVQCAGSRDQSIGVPYCSRVCCMYAIKQAMLLSGSLPTTDITIYYMDIRAFGKGYEQFFQTAKAMGINFVKAKVARIAETEEKNLILRIERQEALSQPEEVQHDLVVLSLGLKPHWDPKQQSFGIAANADGFVDSPAAPVRPNVTTVEGIFAAGTATGPKDIVDSIAEACAGAMEVENHLRRISWRCE